ncbi:MAG: hypothetical protein PUC51_08645, partial [Ruminococcus sp.]|nr:hypothetical protein [Ruminococcus sp.]
EQVNGYRKTASVSTSWQPYGASAHFDRHGNNFTIYRDNSRNKNASWGYTQSFRKKLSFSSSPKFCVSLRVSGANKGYAQSKIRFFSGKQYFECTMAIPTDRTVHLSTSLAKWKYRKKVTKIQILAQPVKGETWNSDAQFDLTAPVRSR